MAEENKPADADKNTKQEEIKPDFKWTLAYIVGANSPAIAPAMKTQERVLKELFPKRKKRYSLPAWHMQNKAASDDDLLFLMCGFVHPAESEMLHYYISRWENQVIAEKTRDFSNDDDDDDLPRGGSHRISIPRPTLRNFLAEQGNFMLDNHENLLLRLSAARPMVEELDRALQYEGVRRSRDQWVSAMDELVAQNEYEASVPANEDICWIWMNKMCAPAKKGFWKMDLSTTRSLLGELNWFRIYKSFANIWDYADKPLCTQRVDGELKKCLVPWISAKIMMTVAFLTDEKFLDKKVAQKVFAMTPQERIQEEQMLKRTVVSAFLTDISKASPTSELLAKLMGGFGRYFSPILRKTGYPTFEQSPALYKNAKGQPSGLANVVKVSFYNTSEERKKAVDQAQAKKKITPPAPNLPKPEGRVD